MVTRKLALLAALLLALLAGHALALVGDDDGFTGTVPLPEAVEEVTPATALRDAGRALRNAVAGRSGAEKKLTIARPEKTGVDFEEDTTWTATVSGGSGNYRYKFYLENKIDPNGGLTNDNVNLHGCRDEWSTDNTFTYRLVVPEVYFLVVFVEDLEETDESGRALAASGGFRYIVSDDSRITAAQKVSELAGECLRACGGEASDYEKALWMHDWITRNAYYSQGEHYYSEDGVLIRGEGVCDSYCKAYRLLLNAVGIECDRIFGQAVSSGVNHAWNRAKLSGEWHQIDPTWDDPGSDEEPVSGRERHLYFGLTDALMRQDHTYDASDGAPCASLAGNYYIQTGHVEAWLADTRGAIREIVRSGDAARSVPIAAGGYRDETDRGISNTWIPYGIMCWRLAQDYSQLVDVDGRVVRVDYDVAQARITDAPVVYLNSVATEVDALCLPAALGELGERAFAGGGSAVIALPDGISEIPDGAFADCAALRAVFVPSSVGSISPTAFEGSGQAVVICERGSAAHAFARQAGIPFRLY